MFSHLRHHRIDFPTIVVKCAISNLFISLLGTGILDGLSVVHAAQLGNPIQRAYLIRATIRIVARLFDLLLHQRMLLRRL